MERIGGVNNWRLTIRREEAGVTLLRAATCDRRAALPEALFGLPVTALGDHALAPGRRPPEGEEVLVTCGPAGDGEDWDNSGLEDLRLPDSLLRAGDYAFFNCAALKTLRLRDTVRYWGGGALMNCRGLAAFHLTCTGQEGELLAYLADELPRELDVTLHWTDGTLARLIFPEYVEVYEENCPAHHFDYNICGAGYSYHHCFYRKQLSLKAYDELWRPMLGMEHDADCAMRLAWWRLRYPAELSARAEADYLAYLRENALSAARWLLAERDAAGLRFLLSRAPLSREALTELCGLARRSEAPEALALLLEEQHRRFSGGIGKSFDL
ncbi:hypothetical protein [uncultured Dysosmobacter sp.]|uniref:hypothetical protein n=1 Tax=uncultured Dysosmobacter sp. TaxID=2591384 RepID=UPI002609BA75|nr:hypothetical protein [uncultured Dysosmobacter sp.]